ncbi:hypothetical protein STANM309S_06635 [Streptomyces tanashiensis]
MMLSRASNTPGASPNLWIVVMMIFRAPAARSSCSSLRDSVETRFGTSEALNVAVIWVSRSIRSTTMITVGEVSPAVARNFCAVNTISSDFPDPWKCQISPCLICPCSTRSTIRLVAWSCWYLAITLILRCFLSVANSVKNRRKSKIASGSRTPSTASLTTERPTFTGVWSSPDSSARHGPHSSTGIPTEP